MRARCNGRGRVDGVPWAVAVVVAVVVVVVVLQTGKGTRVIECGNFYAVASEGMFSNTKRIWMLY